MLSGHAGFPQQAVQCGHGRSLPARLWGVAEHVDEQHSTREPACAERRVGCAQDQFGLADPRNLLTAVVLGVGPAAGSISPMSSSRSPSRPANTTEASRKPAIAGVISRGSTTVMSRPWMTAEKKIPPEISFLVRQLRYY